MSGFGVLHDNDLRLADPDLNLADGLLAVFKKSRFVVRSCQARATIFAPVVKAGRFSFSISLTTSGAVRRPRAMSTDCSASMMICPSNSPRHPRRSSFVVAMVMVVMVIVARVFAFISRLRCHVRRREPMVVDFNNQPIARRVVFIRPEQML